MQKSDIDKLFLHLFTQSATENSSQPKTVQNRNTDEEIDLNLESMSLTTMALMNIDGYKPKYM